MTGEFPEDKLDLLGPSVHSLSPGEFHERILSLYRPRSGGKTVDPQVKGKKLKSPTKKAPGQYELRFITAMGEHVAIFSYGKELVFEEKLLPRALEYLYCSEAKLRDFLKKKKFTISSCSGLADGLDREIIKVIASPGGSVAAEEAPESASQEESALA